MHIIGCALSWKEFNRDNTITDCIDNDRLTNTGTECRSGSEGLVQAAALQAEEVERAWAEKEISVNKP